MRLLNSIFSLPYHFSRLDKHLKGDAYTIQRKVLKKLISKAAKTEWGRKYNYSNIKCEKSFRQEVPIQAYEDLQSFIERMQAGEKNVLWPGKIKQFACSSGTTGAKSKYIPIPRESLKGCHYKAMRDMISAYVGNDKNSALLTGKTLTLGGSQKKNDSNLYVGDLSAILMSNVPLLAKSSRIPNLEIALLGEWEEKIERIIDSALPQNVTGLAGTPSWMLVLLYKILKKTGKSNILEVWPNLELFIHGGVSFKPYKKQFEKIIPSEKMKYLEVYNASEGFFARNEKPGDEDMLLLLDVGIFYEFIPMDEINKSNPRAISLEDVEIGRNYALLISTNGGLWRYLIGDTIKFTNLSPHKIKITGRTKHFINAFGEELMIGNADCGLEMACSKTGATICDYTAAPIFMDEKNKGRHEWLIEFSKEPDDDNKFCLELDNALKSLNSDYEAKRYKDITLGIPKIVKAKPKLFYNWLREKGKLSGQSKIPRLANDRSYIDDLLKTN